MWSKQCFGFLEEMNSEKIIWQGSMQLGLNDLVLKRRSTKEGKVVFGGAIESAFYRVICYASFGSLSMLPMESFWIYHRQLVG